MTANIYIKAKEIYFSVDPMDISTDTGISPSLQDSLFSHYMKTETAFE